MAIEFDTFNNLNPNEIEADHIAIFKNGEERSPLKPPVPMSSTAANTEDGANHKVQIIWRKSTNTLFVYFDGVLREKYSEDFVNTVFSGNPVVYFGYTASTGGYSNQQSVCDITVNPLNADGDPVADADDLDDDNDGIPDTLESNGADPSADHDDDGLPNFRDADFGPLNGKGVVASLDKDGDGLINAFDLDTDGDGITDVVEQAAFGNVPANDYNNNTGRLTSPVNSNGIPSSSTITTEVDLNDFDGDGLKNFLDIDADNDGLRDYLEAQATPGQMPTLPAGTDTDQDGIDDNYDATCGCTINGVALSPQNFGPDGDNYPDYLDLDSDNDLSNDAIEAYDSTDPATADGKSLNELKALAAEFTNRAGNAGNGAAASFYVNTLNIDGDNVPDWLEDDNNNGIPNYLELGTTFYHDTDTDGWVDLFDNSNYGFAPAANYKFRENAVIVVLPVELTTFTAKSDKSEVRLYWETASEKDNDYFIVERSSDGITFQAIEKVKGAGNSQQVTAYIFSDNQPVNGTSYYRLTMVDYNGRTSHSPIISVKREGLTEPRLLAYPNPTAGKLTLEVTISKADKLTILILDVTGKALQNSTINAIAGRNVINLNIEEMPGRMYLIVVKATGFQLVQRLIKY